MRVAVPKRYRRLESIAQRHFRMSFPPLGAKLAEFFRQRFGSFLAFEN